MAVHSFLTIAGPAAGSYREKGSKFLAYAYPAQDEDEIKEQLEALKKKYFDARHHCFAWILGAEASHYRAYDDGEPNHSAGDPILGQIRSKNLTYVHLVVVRYFGGVKLGVGGLVNAYKTAAEDALSQASIVQHEITRTLRLNYTYEDTAEVMRLVKELDIRITAQDFQAQCLLKGEVRLPAVKPLQEKISLLQATGHQVLLTLDHE